MNEFTAKNEQAFLEACGAIGVEPNAIIVPHKERYLVSEFLKDPVSWLETEFLYYSYTNPRRGPEGRQRHRSNDRSSTKAFKGASGYSVRVLIAQSIAASALVHV
jgi:hypothetical protein